LRACTGHWPKAARHAQANAGHAGLFQKITPVNGIVHNRWSYGLRFEAFGCKYFRADVSDKLNPDIRKEMAATASNIALLTSHKGTQRPQ
jgi:hypothetical protein